MPRPTFRAPLRQSSGRPRTAHSLSALGIELHGLVSYPEALALAQARSFLRLHPSFDPVLIMNLEQTRIRVDVLCPQLLHHRPLVGPIIFPIREYVSKLAWIHASWRSKRWKLLSANGRRRAQEIL